MEKVVFSVYDIQAEIYDQPMVFDNVKLAIAGIRRNIRDLFIKGDVNIDSLRDRKLVMLAVYDSVTGKFKEIEEDKKVTVRLSDFVGDLVMNDGNEV